MRKIKEVLRLYFECGLSQRKIAESCSIARSTVGDYLNRAQAVGVSWPLPEGLSEEDLDAKLFPCHALRQVEHRPEPEWEEIHKEARKKGVTLLQLWVEYKEKNPTGYQYSRFCQLYRAWQGRVDPCLHQEYKAGEVLFVDYCGQTMPVIDRSTGEVKSVQIFVAVLGASNFTYAEATGSQSLPDWIGSHVRALEFLDGCPEVVVPDNLKSGVSRVCRYEPDLNPTYQDLAMFYGFTVLPARVRKPRDKAKVEKGVQTVEQWILAPLRNRQFFSLAELNRAIAEGLAELNERPFQKVPGCRRSWFENLERPVLKPLPPTPYEYAEWKKATVHLDYHIAVNRHYYSVPHSYIRKKVDVRLTDRTIEIFSGGKRIASHMRSDQPGRYTTEFDHMPQAHRDYHEWSPERIRQWAERIGPFTLQLVTLIMERRSHPAQGYRTCLGILRLAKQFGSERLEAACQRAVLIGALSYKSVHSILQKGLDRLDPPSPAPSASPIDHLNIRGSSYYH